LSLKKLVNGRMQHSLGRAGGFFRSGILMLSVNLFYLIDQAEGILGSIVVDNLVSSGSDLVPQASWGA